MADSDLLASALSRLTDDAGAGLPRLEVIERLRYPQETRKARISIRMDDGALRSFPAWRCRYDDSLGPTKGGVRFHPAVSGEEVESLAFWMTFKCAVAGLPFGGGKGGVRVDPDTLSPAELERLARAYVRAFAQMIGPERDIPGPDVGTNAQIMGWMADEYAALVGRPAPAAFTGKPVGRSGSAGREEATSMGGFLLIDHVSMRLGLGAGQRAAIQGLGNVGLGIAQLLAKAGWRIVAVADSKRSLIRSDGLDMEAIARAKREGASIAASAGVVEGPPQDVLAADCDLLIPAALENAITAGNAAAVRARVVLEMANGPTTPQADAILAERGVTVVPDILANAGGVIVSYFEWVQNRRGLTWDLEAVRARLRSTLETSAGAVFALAEKNSLSLRSTAYALGLERLTRAVAAQGTVADSAVAKKSSLPGD